MTETDEQLAKDDSAGSGKTLAIVAVASILGQIFARNIDGLPYPVSIMLAYLVVLLIGYWIGLRPPLSFGRFVLTLVGYMLLLTAGLWAVPVLLSRWIWTPLAFGGPILVVGISSYWLPPLLPRVGQKKQALWVWILLFSLFALFWGYVGPRSLR